MKKIILYILPLAVLFSACDREDFFEGAAISFYPTVVALGAEEDGNTYVLSLGTSGFIDSEGTATIQVNMSADGVLATVPPMEGNRIKLELSNTSAATITVTVLNDQVPEDYKAEFIIVGVGGELAGIGNDKFTLFVNDGDAFPVFGETFDDCVSLNSFTAFSALGAQVWDCTTFGLSGSAAQMNGYSGGNQNNEDWLISETMDLSAYSDLSAHFYSDVAFNGPALEFRVSTDFAGGDPTAATWTTLDAVFDSSTDSDTWTSSGKIDINDYLTTQSTFAFVYKSTTGGAARWTVDEFEINLFHPNASGNGNSNAVVLPYSLDFEDCTTDFTTPEQFEVWTVGANTSGGWECRGFGVDDSRGLRVTAFNKGSGVMDTWIISSSKFDARSMPSATLSFDAKSTVNNDGLLHVYYSTNYFGEGPYLGTWKELDVADQLPVKGSNSYTNVTAEIDGGSYFYLAYRFEGGSTANSAYYDLDNISITPYEFGTLPFSEDFAGCGDAGTFNIPSGWREVNIPGTKTDRGWGCNDFGRTGTGMRASAFGGAAGTDDAWLISDGKFNFTDLTNVTLKFWVEDRFVGPGELEVKWSSDYDGSGNPNSFTWTTLADVDAQLPADNSAAYKEITSSLNGAAGQQVYLAFRYYQGTNSAAGAFTLDDISITGN